jgi:hypothetical protein
LGTCGICGAIFGSNSPNDILRQIPSAIACQNNCASKPDCYSWQYEATLDCKLFGGQALLLAVNDANVISGPKNCSHT